MVGREAAGHSSMSATRRLSLTLLMWEHVLTTRQTDGTRDEMRLCAISWLYSSAEVVIPALTGWVQETAGYSYTLNVEEITIGSWCTL